MINNKIVKKERLVNKLEKLIEIMNKVDQQAAVSFSYNSEQERVKMVKKVV
ncbi:hypothetical protein [Gracilibacillus xinjiangensis]|uniref:Uncharacterized protein n=1 Tax=Gracilibacillus xinjiangensis TaxID=1193282 RepID=A0ABV8WYN2_9BACI